MPSKSKEELAEEFSERFHMDRREASVRSYKAGYSAGLESEEVKGLVEIAKQWRRTLHDFSPTAIMLDASIQAFTKSGEE